MTNTNARRLSAGLFLGAAALTLAGCSAGPTYGTGTSQSEQLFSDIDGIFSLGSGGRDEEQISYAPRPELVRPAAIGALPPPRPANAAANDPSWPQSPEVIRGRNLAAAEATRDAATLPADFNPSTGPRRPRDPNAIRPTDDAALDRSTLTPAELRGQRRAVAAQRAATVQGSPTQRRYLSEPPVNYRQPVASAPVGDLGVDEEIKQRRADGVRPLGARIRDAMPF